MQLQGTLSTSQRLRKINYSINLPQSYAHINAHVGRGLWRGVYAAPVRWCPPQMPLTSGGLGAWCLGPWAGSGSLGSRCLWAGLLGGCSSSQGPGGVWGWCVFVCGVDVCCVVWVCVCVFVYMCVLCSVIPMLLLPGELSCCYAHCRIVLNRSVGMLPLLFSAISRLFSSYYSCSCGALCGLEPAGDV